MDIVLGKDNFLLIGLILQYESGPGTVLKGSGLGEVLKEHPHKPLSALQHLPGEFLDLLKPPDIRMQLLMGIKPKQLRLWFFNKD